MTKSYMAKTGEVEAQWHVVDATGQVLGRMATRIATILQGKHRPTYTPHVDTGDFVVVVNADKVKVTGRKLDQKLYYRATSYVGSLKSKTLRQMMASHPDRVVSEAVRRMLPTSKLGRSMLSKLKVYAGAEHPHEAQSPEPLVL
ncbi:50S ribosomal protein L13 [bacterium]|nr:50S ribosomal protein L13 [bacterium]